MYYSFSTKFIFILVQYGPYSMTILYVLDVLGFNLVLKKIGHWRPCPKMSCSSLQLVEDFSSLVLEIFFLALLLPLQRFLSRFSLFYMVRSGGLYLLTLSSLFVEVSCRGGLYLQPRYKTRIYRFGGISYKSNRS